LSGRHKASGSLYENGHMRPGLC